MTPTTARFPNAPQPPLTCSRWRTLVCSICLLAFSALPGRTNTPGEVHYPDLVTLPPSEVRLQNSAGRRYLRFSNVIANLGRGRLEVFAEHNAATGMTDAFQQLYTHDSSGNWIPTATRHVGTFEFHSTHDHWHLEGFARYELRDVAPDGSIGGTILSLSAKVSFCLLDSVAANLNLEHAEPRTFTQCGVDIPQGISVGWADVYRWNLPGQSLDITGLSNGTYWLVSTADPFDLLAEGGGAAEINNTGAVKINIKGGKARIVE